jgi:hypothetical protein
VTTSATWVFDQSGEDNWCLAITGLTRSSFAPRKETVGMLRLVGLSQPDPGVTIRYKLINPASFVFAAKT